ncbi:hypothetical protein [Kerstersia similis]|uniref:hypothetical protein n=1 Tax=Kerstersia similis TaxID=206505 RepID=UPI0039F141E6
MRDLTGEPLPVNALFFSRPCPARHFLPFDSTAFSRTALSGRYHPVSPRLPHRIALAVASGSMPGRVVALTLSCAGFWRARRLRPPDLRR